jgi:hypothetical protein
LVFPGLIKITLITYSCRRYLKNIYQKETAANLGRTISALIVDTDVKNLMLKYSIPPPLVQHYNKATEMETGMYCCT